MKKKLVSALLCATMAASLLAGCGSGDTSDTGSSGKKGDAKTEVTNDGKILNIYCWNDEFQSRITDHYPDYKKVDATHGKIGDIDVVWNITPSENNAYQNNLDETLLKQADASADDKIDLFLVEADYAPKYVDSDYTMDIKDLGLTDDDLSEQYQYTKDIVTVDGTQKGTTWQATPGLFAYRRSIAKDVLGTDDPEQVQAAVADWDKFNAVAEKANEKGYKMLSGYDDAYRTFSNNVAAPWVDGKTVKVDENIMKWVDQTKTFTDKGYNNKTSLWDDAWAKDQGPEGKVFGFFYSTWGINFTLLGNSLADPDGEKEVGNGIYGDYAVCQGPEPYYWGGTWICAATGTDNKDEVADIMKKLTCDKDIMKQITLDTEDYTNNKSAMKEIADDPDYGSAFLGGQNHIKLFAEQAEKIDMSNAGKYDQGCNENLEKVEWPSN